MGRNLDKMNNRPFRSNWSNNNSNRSTPSKGNTGIKDPKPLPPRDSTGKRHHTRSTPGSTPTSSQPSSSNTSLLIKKPHILEQTHKKKVMGDANVRIITPSQGTTAPTPTVYKLIGTQQTPVNPFQAFERITSSCTE